MSESAFNDLVAAQANTNPGPFWIVDPTSGQSVAATGEELQAKVDAGYNGPVALQSDNAWKETPSDFGYAKTVVAEEAPPAPPAAPAAPTPPAAPAAPETAAATPEAPATTAVSTEVKEEGESAGRALQELVTDEASALAILGTLTNSDGKSLAEIADTDSGGGGMAHSLPFTKVTKGNWDTHASWETSPVGDFLPVGNRPYTAIYIAQRIGATSWMGKGSAGGGGNPPMYRYVVPSIKVHPDGEFLANETMVASRNVQFCKGGEVNRVKFDQPDIGRLTPELQVLVWTPEVGFLILVCANFSPTELSLAALKSVDAELIFQPVKFSIKEEEQINKKVMKEDPNADNAKWEIAYIAGEFDPTPNKGVPMKQAFDEFLKRDAVAAVNTIENFRKGTDYAGLTPEEVKARLAGFKPLITQSNK